MRVAVVIHGLVGGLSGRNGHGQPTDLRICSSLMFRNIINPNNADVFLHSWSYEYEADLVQYYRPVKHLVEPQKLFGFPAQYNQNNQDNVTEMFRVVSRYASLCEATKLKSEYEREHRFVYDRVVVVRPDLVFLNPVSVDKTQDGHIYICHEPQYDSWQTNIHAAEICHDTVFVAESRLIDELAKTYSMIIDGALNQKIQEWINIGIPHRLIYYRLVQIVGKSKILNLLTRYQDVEIFRFVMHPETNPFAKEHGGFELLQRMQQELAKCQK